MFRSRSLLLLTLSLVLLVFAPAAATEKGVFDSDGVPIHYLGAVPEDPAVSHRRLGQAPLMIGVPECEMTKAIVGLLTALEGQIMETRAMSGNRGVEARMLAQIRRW